MTLIIARKTITAVFGTMALQLIEAIQCSVNYLSKQACAFFDCWNAKFRAARSRNKNFITEIKN